MTCSRRIDKLEAYVSLLADEDTRINKNQEFKEEVSNLTDEYVKKTYFVDSNILKLDYIDIVYAHRFDINTPLEETCRAMSWLIKKGLCFYWGTSDWTPSQIMEAIKICNKLKLEKGFLILN